MAHVVDSILDLKAKDMGLHTILDSQLAESLSIFNIETNSPGYDYLKRYKALANTTFKVLIEFDGEKWLKTQDLDDLENQREGTLKFYEAFQSILSEQRKMRINKAIQQLSLDSNSTRNGLKYLHLFETKTDLKEFVHKTFELHEKDNKKLKELVRKAFATGLLEYNKKPLYHLKMNKEKLQKFHNSIYC